MKRLLLGAAAAAMALTGFAAQAQPYRGYDHGSRSYDQHRDWNRGHDERHDWNRGYDRHDGWRVGQRYPDYARRDRMITNWRAYNLPAPRAGYGYYRDDNGDVVMAALAGGLIGLVLGNMTADHNSYGYAQPYGYTQPYGYGYAPSYNYGYRGW